MTHSPVLDNGERLSVERRAQITAFIAAVVVCMLKLADKDTPERTDWTWVLYVAACVNMFVAEITERACFYLPYLVVNGVYLLYGAWTLMYLVVMAVGFSRRPEDYELLTEDGATKVQANDIATWFTMAVIWNVATAYSEWIVYKAHEHMKNNA